jgi:hypothetical protein
MECDESSIGLAQEHVHPAGLGEGGGQLRQGERAAEAQHPTDHPDGQHQDGRFDAPRDLGGDDEDPRADHRADEDADDVDEAEHTAQMGRF